MRLQFDSMDELPPGSRCRCVIRQALPCLLKRPRNAVGGDLQAVDFNGEGTIGIAAMDKICLARNVPLCRRDRRSHSRNAHSVNRIDACCDAGTNFRSGATSIQRIFAGGFKGVAELRRAKRRQYQDRALAEIRGSCRCARVRARLR
jgi:hypothetical protein